MIKTALKNFLNKFSFKDDFFSKLNKNFKKDFSAELNKNTLEDDFYSKFDLNPVQEEFFSKKIIAGGYEIYPYHRIKIIYSHSELVANASIESLAIVILDKNEDEYYIHLFDDAKKDDETYINEILEKFVDFAKSHH